MRFAKWTFWIAGIYGLLVLTPMYFMERQVGRDDPPAVTHPEFYYGFIGVALAFQILFIQIGRNPSRLRPAMVASIVEKGSFVLACAALYADGRLSTRMLAAAGADGLLGTLFLISYIRTRNAA